jgi:hypothetical protein
VFLKNLFALDRFPPFFPTQGEEGDEGGLGVLRSTDDENVGIPLVVGVFNVLGFRSPMNIMHSLPMTSDSRSHPGMRASGLDRVVHDWNLSDRYTITLYLPIPHLLLLAGDVGGPAPHVAGRCARVRQCYGRVGNPPLPYADDMIDERSVAWGDRWWNGKLRTAARATE